MRAALPLLLLVGGCLSSPTGRAPGDIDASADAPIDGTGASWPPPAANIVAIGSGDLDGDGKDDIIAVDQGGNGRVFLLRGGVDIVATTSAVTSASESVPLAGLRPPAAAIVATNAAVRYVVVLDNPPAGPRLTVLDDQLGIVSQSSAGTTPAGAGTNVTLVQTTFGMNMNAVFGSIPDGVFFIEGSALPSPTPTVMQIPEVGATAFANVSAVAGFVATGPTPIVVVSEPDHAQKANVSGPGQFNWTTVRATGSVWSAQAVADITGDTFNDIVGFAPEGASDANICVLDAQMGQTPACYVTPFGMDTVTGIAVGPVASAGQRDVVLLSPTPGQATMTGVFVVANLRVNGSVMADGVSPPTDFLVTDGMLALAQLDAAGEEIIVMGRDGAVVCARSNGIAAPVRCAP